MRLLGYELKKILTGAVLWVFALLCVAFNMFAIPLNTHFELDTTTSFHINVFEQYNTSEVAEIYISALGLTGRVAESMRAKFDDLQIVADGKAIAGYSYSSYFGEYTYAMHIRLFDNIGVMGILLFQGILLAVLVTLLSEGYEQINHTEHSVYDKKKGRRILRYKISASLIVSIGLYSLLTAITLAVYFNAVDYSNVWDSSVSSGFNYLVDAFTVRPFTTWQSFTVRSYLLAGLGMSLGLIICFSLMGAIVGTLSKNGYMGFLVVVLINAVCVALPIILSVNSYMRYILFHSPIWLWLNNGLWFTDGGFITLWRNFELWGLGVSLLFLAVVCILAVKKFEKRNIV
jgi:hypothetical protein